MTIRRNAILTSLLMAACGAWAQEPQQGLKITGSVGAGVLSSHTSSQNPWKAKEYRDLETGIVTGAEIKGRSPDYYFDVFGENFGRDDMGLEAKGGKYGSFKYQLYDERMVHNWTFGAKTPYANVGSANLTATLPNLNTATWNTFDFSKKRENLGGMFEISAGSPWFLRTDFNEVTERGLQLIGGSNGTSPGNGFIDKPFPVDYKTRNAALEGGYASRTAQFSVSVLHSTFANQNDTLRWTNPFFGNGQDTTWLAPDNTYTKVGANGVLKQLPLGSTLSGRLSWSRSSNNIDIAPTALNTGGVFSPTNPSASNFNGNIDHQTASASLHSNWSRDVDSRVYWNWFRKDNRSTQVTFATAAVAGLACGGLNCTTDTLSYRKNNVGGELGYRFNPQNRVIGGLDYVDLNRNRVDFDHTQDKKASLEYRNTSLDWLSTRVKYQYMERRSHFLEGNSGVNGGDPAFLDRFISRFDASNVDQNLFKVAFDVQPAPLWDVGLEAILKENKYKDTVLGRTKDNRQQYYGSVAYGDIKSFRVMLFGDVEFVKYEAIHRNISQLTAAGGVTANAIYDPNAPAQCNGGSCNYNWAATNRDRNWAVGIGADWLPLERLKLNGSLTYQWTHGTADFALQQTSSPIVPAAVPIQNFDNTRKVTLNFKGTYSVAKPLDITAGWAHEKYRFSDIALDGYQYTIGAGTSASYLSGAYAFPNYTLNLFYIAATYKFL
jgi:MtrB/PioB family decaheme-associated outer membrane protein